MHFIRCVWWSQIVVLLLNLGNGSTKFCLTHINGKRHLLLGKQKQWHHRINVKHTCPQICIRRTRIYFSQLEDFMNSMEIWLEEHSEEESNQFIAHGPCLNKQGDTITLWCRHWNDVTQLYQLQKLFCLVLQCKYMFLASGVTSPSEVLIN